jgi:hypothetical protein
MIKRILAIILSIVTIFSLFTISVSAEETKGEYRLGELYNTGKDNGYSKRNSIGKDDPHYNWSMGDFFVTGFTRQVLDGDTPVFLKNAGDKVTLWFDLQQDIKALNGNKNLYVCEDTNGYEETYKVAKQNLKKGTLIIKHTDYQNKDGLSQIHIDFLSAKVSKDANTEVLLCEEGDYEVSLLYEIKDDNFLFFDSYYNYRIDFKFSVRNGNTMVFPFDVLTGQELTNNVFTENGFYIDLADSRYLNIDIKREILTEGVDGLVEDTRYNRPAADGEKFTEEGIYTITATNQYTNVKTEKKIYVGNNSLLKAHVVTGLSIEEIKYQVADCKAIIDDNGNIVPVKANMQPETNKEIQNEDNNSFSSTELYIIIAVSACILLVIVVSLIFVIKKKKAKKMLQNDSTDNKDK